MAALQSAAGYKTPAPYPCQGDSSQAAEPQQGRAAAAAAQYAQPARWPLSDEGNASPEGGGGGLSTGRTIGATRRIAACDEPAEPPPTEGAASLTLTLTPTLALALALALALTLTLTLILTRWREPDRPMGW